MDTTQRCSKSPESSATVEAIEARTLHIYHYTTISVNGTFVLLSNSFTTNQVQLENHLLQESMEQFKINRKNTSRKCVPSKINLMCTR